MKKSIFQEKNLVSPNDIFNSIGNKYFGKEWTNLPLRVLGTRTNKLKISDKEYRRNKYMAYEVWQKLKKWLKDPAVIIYADKAEWDEDTDEINLIEWKLPFRLSLSADLLLIEKGTRKNGKLIKREFWIEMPKEVNPLLLKKVGKKPEHDKEYMKSIFPDVAKLIKGKASLRSLADAYDDFLKKKNIKAPSKNWIHENLDFELKKLKENQ